jgi:predicted kinase
MIIEVLVGMISSGKSTWAKERAREHWIILNDDSIVSAVHAGQYTLYDKSLKPLYKSIEDHILHLALAMGKNVVIDRGVDVSIRSRRRWIAIAKSLDVSIHAVVFERFTAEVHGVRRAAADNRGHTEEYWIGVARAHEARYETPTLEEGFDKIVERKWQE